MHCCSTLGYKEENCRRLGGHRQPKVNDNVRARQKCNATLGVTVKDTRINESQVNAFSSDNGVQLAQLNNSVVASASLPVENGVLSNNDKDISVDNLVASDDVAASLVIFEKSLASGSARKSYWHNMVLKDEQNTNTFMVRDTVVTVVEETQQVSKENNMVLEKTQNANTVMGTNMHTLVEETQQVSKQISSVANVARTTKQGEQTPVSNTNRKATSTPKPNTGKGGKGKQKQNTVTGSLNNQTKKARSTTKEMW